MKKIILPFIISISLVNSTFAANANPQPAAQQIVWTAVFSNVMPTNTKVTTEYCLSHTPTVIVTTIDQITSPQGINALNGVNIRYLSYKTQQKEGLYFNIVNAIVSGKDSAGKKWSTPMKLYEQTLTPVDVTYTVWSTADCKGTFLGTPTVINN